MRYQLMGVGWTDRSFTTGASISNASERLWFSRPKCQRPCDREKCRTSTEYPTGVSCELQKNADT